VSLSSGALRHARLAIVRQASIGLLLGAVAIWTAAVPLLALWRDHFRDDAVWTLRQPSFVGSIAISPDGRLLVTGADDGSSSVWDIDSRAKVADLPVSDGPVEVMAFSPDGNWIATGSRSGRLRILAVGSGQMQWDLSAHSGSVRAVAFSVGGALVATTGDDERIKIRDLTSGRLLFDLKNGGNSSAIAFGSTGGRLMVFTGKGSKNIDLESGRVQEMRAAPSISRHGFAATPDGSHLLFSAIESELPTDADWQSGPIALALWDARRDEFLRKIGQSSRLIMPVALSADGRIGASVHWRRSGGERVVQVWDLETAASVALLYGHTHGVHALAVSPHGEYIVSTAGDGVKVWRPGRGTERYPINRLVK
jgi:WD40 repeat protein